MSDSPRQLAEEVLEISNNLFVDLNGSSKTVDYILSCKAYSLAKALLELLDEHAAAKRVAEAALEKRRAERKINPPQGPGIQYKKPTEPLGKLIAEWDRTAEVYDAALDAYEKAKEEKA